MFISKKYNSLLLYSVIPRTHRSQGRNLCDGVCRAVFPPYQSCQSEEKFVRLYDQQRTEENCSDETGSQDESAGTVKLRNCLIKPSFLDATQKNNDQAVA
uniref:Uncharacterized protein n=1 Tax=Meloidogyne enterolobii TaxID=390850 RepID=A0A6V7XHC5_MELEN|nr:unnamed protein product [Meloidogyne enterolobii]